jgi:hypothetical protein
MLNGLRTMLLEARPIDIIMLVVEFLVLAVILLEFLWRVTDWWSEHKEAKRVRKAIGDSLNPLSDTLKKDIRDYILQDRIPAEWMGYTLFGKTSTGIIERDPTTAWIFSKEHKAHLRWWANRQKKL